MSGSAPAVAVNQAGGALTWNGDPAVRTALAAAAEKSMTPYAPAGGRERPHDRLHHDGGGDPQEARRGAPDGDLPAVRGRAAAAVVRDGRARPHGVHRARHERVVPLAIPRLVDRRGLALDLLPLHEAPVAA